MPGTRIFLSYRRDDGSGYAELLFDKLAGRYGRAAVFRDVHKIRPSDDFQLAIDAALAECAIVIVVISKLWASITDASGVRRLANPDDVLCGEIASALA